MRPTIKDVAKEAGVSIATVSRVMNNKNWVKDETKEKILAAIDRLSYVTNSSAKNLRKNKTDSIGVIVPEVSVAFYAEILKGIENKANKMDLRLIVCDAENNIKKERDFARFLYDHSIDGLILILPQMRDEEIIRLKEDKQTVVVFGRDMQPYNIPSITVENVLGACNAVMHLYSHGYTRIAYIGGMEDDHLIDRQERLKGYTQGLEKCGLPLRTEYIENGKYQEELAGNAFLRLMKLPEPPDAVFCGNDEMALGVLRAAKKTGVRIPDQVGLIGFDNIPVCQYTSPALTTVNQPTYTIGNLCCEKLIYSMTDKDDSIGGANLVLRPDLILRESCGC